MKMTNEAIRITVLTILGSVMRTTRVREWESMPCVDILHSEGSGFFNAEVTVQAVVTPKLD